MTNYAEKLISAFGPPENQGGPQKVFDTSNEIPDALRDLWLAHGFASYQHGFYWNTNPADFAQLKKMWPRIKGNIVVFGRDCFANCYFLSDGRVKQLNPASNEIVEIAPGIEVFFRALVGDKDFRNNYMWENLFPSALSRNGPIASDECYGFFPALRLGGSFSADTLRRVKLDEHLQFLSQI